MIVGGNIRGRTRVMTTAISLLNSRGEREQAIILGVILLAIALSVQVIADLVRKQEQRTDENI